MYGVICRGAAAVLASALLPVVMAAGVLELVVIIGADWPGRTARAFSCSQEPATESGATAALRQIEPSSDASAGQLVLVDDACALGGKRGAARGRGRSPTAGPIERLALGGRHAEKAASIAATAGVTTAPGRPKANAAAGAAIRLGQITRPIAE